MPIESADINEVRYPDLRQEGELLWGDGFKGVKKSEFCRGKKPRFAEVDVLGPDKPVQGFTKEKQRDDKGACCKEGSDVAVKYCWWHG